jgi:hypothetical protein
MFLVNPWLLLGLAAAGLPVLIHFLTRARPRRVAFPPFRFLVEACSGQQSLDRLRTFVLLATRCLLIICLVLWFTRPCARPAGATDKPESRKRVALLIDASLSMRMVQSGLPLFARAKAEAAEVLRGLETGSEASVILVGAQPRPLLPTLSPNLPALHEALVNAAPTYEAADFPSALALAKRTLGAAGTLYLFSDFQKANWEGVGPLPDGLMVRLRPATAATLNNCALVDARTVPEQPVPGEITEILGTVFNGTSLPLEKTVRLQLGETAREARVTVPAFGTAACAFTLTFPREGLSTGKLWLDPDDLREDDTRYLAVRVQKSLQILLLSDADTNDTRSAAFYISRALIPSPESAPGFHLFRRHSQDADRGILETADLFLLAPPVSLSGEASEILTRRVLEGGRFLAVLDGPSASGLIPTAFAPPFQLQRSVESAAGDALVPGARKLFVDADSGDWAGIRFRRHCQNLVLPGRAGEVLFSYPDNSAALTLSKAGKGAVVLVNLPLTPDAGNFLGHPLFPATIHELTRLLRQGAQSGAIHPGAAFVLEVPAPAEAALRAADPEGAPIEAQVLARGRVSRLAFPPARLPGIYEIHQGSTLVGAEAVNVDPRESDPRPVPLEQIKAGTGASVAVVNNEEDLMLAGKDRALWPRLAAATLLLLGAETALLVWWRRPPARAFIAKGGAQ